MMKDTYKVEFYGYNDPTTVIGYHIVEDVSKLEANEFAYNMLTNNPNQKFIVLDSGGIRISDIRSFSAKRHY